MKQKFAIVRMEEHKGIEEHLDVFLNPVANLTSLNIKMSDEDQVIQILPSLPKQYESLVDTLKYGSGNDTLTVREVTCSAYSKEVELKEKILFNKAKSNSERLFVSTMAEWTKGMIRHGEEGLQVDQGHSQCQISLRNVGFFGKNEHFKRQCSEKKGNKPTDSVNITSKVTEPLVLTASHHDTIKKCVLDSGCTFHNTPNKDVLFDLKKIE